MSINEIGDKLTRDKLKKIIGRGSCVEIFCKECPLNVHCDWVGGNFSEVDNDIVVKKAKKYLESGEINVAHKLVKKLLGGGAEKKIVVLSMDDINWLKDIVKGLGVCLATRINKCSNCPISRKLGLSIKEKCSVEIAFVEAQDLLKENVEYHFKLKEGGYEK